MVTREAVCLIFSGSKRIEAKGAQEGMTYCWLRSAVGYCLASYHIFIYCTLIQYNPGFEYILSGLPDFSTIIKTVFYKHVHSVQYVMT